MVEEYAEVVVGGVKRTALTPTYGKEYWLKYFCGDCRLGQDPMQGLDAKYFGIADEQHVFFALTPEGEVARYTTHIGDSYLQWENQDSDEGPWLPFLPTQLQGILPHGPQRDYVLTHLKKTETLEKRVSKTNIPTASPRA